MSRPHADPSRPSPTGQATFGALLRQYRLAAGLSQEALAELAGLSGQSLSLLETGKRQAPYRSTIALLVRALGLSAEQMAVLEAAVVRSRMPAGAGIVPFPSLPDTLAPRTNLPVPLTSFIGREREQVEVLALLEAGRLVTLTGTGGAGKTRLAQAVAGAVVSEYPAGVWLIELAPLADPALVPGAVVAALGLREEPGRPLLDTLLAHLTERRPLLVLDNCEHLVGACAELVVALLRACPDLRVLATSREELGVAGERRYRVPSLAVPPRDHLPAPEELGAYAAVALFVTRAQERRADFVLNTMNAPAVVQICTRLDGMPLAIELAAARVGSLPLEAIACRLDDRFKLLTTGPRTAVTRQQTLRATLDWSYDLLSEGERRLLDRLAVFAGGCTLEAAEAVCSGESIEEAQGVPEVADLLGSLVNKSLVVLEEAASDEEHGRFQLLDTVRQYAQERLTAEGGTSQAQRQHTAYFLALAERAELELNGAGQLRWLIRLECEHDNLRAALAWCVERSAHAQGDEDAQAGAIGLRLAGALHWFWLFRDHHAEGLAWLERLLPQGTAAAATVRAKAMCNAGILAGLVNDLTRAHALFTQGVALSREAGDRRQLSYALAVLGSTAWGSAQDEQAAAVLEESLALARAVGEPWIIGHALLHSLFRVANSAAIECAEERARAWTAGAEAFQLFQAVEARMEGAIVQLTLGQIALYEGDYSRARAAFAACLPMLRTLGWRSTVADALVGLADAAREQGDEEEAVTCYAEGLALYRQGGDQMAPVILRVLRRLADLALEQGDWAAAQSHVREVLVIARDTGRLGAAEIADAVEAQAALAAVQGAPVRAVRLAGAAAALRVQSNHAAAGSEQATLERRLTYLPPSPQAPAAAEQATLDRRLATARQVLSAPEQASAWAEGRAMTPAQAIAYALEGLPPTPGMPSPLGAARQDEMRRELALSTPGSVPPAAIASTDVPPLAPQPQRGATNAPVGPRRSRTERQVWALEQLLSAGPLTPRVYATMLAVSVDTALRDLQELVDRGIVQAAGTTRDRRYVLAKEATGPVIHRTAQ